MARINLFSAVKHGTVREIVIRTDLNVHRAPGTDKSGNALYYCMDGVIRTEQGFKASCNSLYRYARRYNMPVTVERPQAPATFPSLYEAKFLPEVARLKALGFGCSESMLAECQAMNGVDLCAEIRRMRDIARMILALEDAA
jgi:hypothetical protein